MAFDKSIPQPSGADGFVQWLMTSTEHVLQSAVNEPMQKLFESIAPVIVVGLSLQFIVYAFAIMQGDGPMTVTEFFKKAIRVAIISGFFGSAGFFQTQIASTMIALPDDMVRAVSTADSFASRIDAIQKETSNVTSAMTGNSKSDNSKPAPSGHWLKDKWNSVKNISFDFNVLPDTRKIMVTILATGMSFSASFTNGLLAVLILVCKVGMALVVVAGPVFIAALLFEPTIKLFHSWVGAALNFVILALLAGLVFGLLLELNLQTIKMIGTQVESGKDLLGLFGVQMLIGVASVAVIIMVPMLASSLSGGFGANFGVGSASHGAFRLVRLFRRR